MDISRRLIVGALASAPMLGLASRASAQPASTRATVILPPKLITPRARPAATPVGDSFSVEGQGYGTFSGLSYTVPAHTNGKVKANIQVLALTSTDVDNLNTLIKGMVSASQYQKVRDYESTHASANLSFWGFWSGGGGASYEKTHEELRGFGLSEDNIKTIVAAMAADAQKMSNVEINFDVQNAANDYAVSGSLQIYTIAGAISSQNQQYQYRMLANKGTAGSGDQTAPATATFTPPSP
jgi:hypothetical protein